MTQRDGVVHISSHNGPATRGRADGFGAQPQGDGSKRVTVQSTTLDDVFLALHRAAELRDATQPRARAYDISHLLSREQAILLRIATGAGKPSCSDRGMDRLR